MSQVALTASEQTCADSLEKDGWDDYGSDEAEDWAPQEACPVTIGLTAAQEQWLTALESGEYEQGFGSLRSYNRFCCLGVACDLFNGDRWGEEEDSHSRYYYPDTRTVRGRDYSDIPKRPHKTDSLPVLVIQHLGFRVESRSVGAFDLNELNSPDHELLKNYLYGDMRSNLSLAILNDGGWSFEKIAGLIRRNPEAFFEGETS